MDLLLDKMPMGPNGHPSIRDADFLSEVLIFAYQQVHHRSYTSIKVNNGRGKVHYSPLI